MPPVDSTPLALKIRQLCKAYGALVAVNSIDLDVYQGECFGLLGPNGAGKTTTIEICEGLLEPDGGTVELLGRDGVPSRRNSARFSAFSCRKQVFPRS